VDGFGERSTKGKICYAMCVKAMKTSMGCVVWSYRAQ
jgi:hypothetical protein